jgi:uncharacterized protein with beta-barrel porin domain
MRPFQFSLRLLAAAAAGAVVSTLGAGQAFAQLGPGGGTPTLDPNVVNSYLSAPGAVFDLSSKFLRDNASAAASSAKNGGTLNALGGGADLASSGAAQTAARPSYRFWMEGYGLRSKTGAQNTFTGDERKTYGGIAGLGVTLPSGWSAGVSFDQGQTKIDVTGLPQSSRIDLSQFGGNIAYETGPWTFTAAAIYGTGDVKASRTDTGGLISAKYDVNLWGTIGEISYYWSTGTETAAWRVVPKIGLDFTRIEIDAFTESGGAIPIIATAQNTERFRGFAGVEVGYSWLVNRTIFDVAGYARFVDIFSQDVDPVLATAANGAALPRLVPGVFDDRFEFAAGASTSAKLSDALRVYAIYDGRFRDGFTSHAGTIGFEYRW